MDTEQLKYFSTVAKYNNFSLASESLCLSQSSLSKHIKSLENEIGIELFDRSTRKVQLTSAGQEFLLFTKEVMDCYEKLNSKIKKFKENERGCIKIGTIPVMSQYGITSLIASFNKKYPQTEIQIIEEKGEEILKLLDETKIDMAFIRTISLQKNDYKIHPLKDDEIVIAVSKFHPLAAKMKISLSEAKREKFIFLDPGTGIYDYCINSCKTAGFNPNIIYTNSRIETIMGLVKENLGITMLMRKVLDIFSNEDISIVELDNKLTTTLSLIFPHGNKLSPEAISFRNYTVKWFNYNKINGSSK